MYVLGYTCIRTRIHGDNLDANIDKGSTTKGNFPALITVFFSLLLWHYYETHNSDMFPKRGTSIYFSFLFYRKKNHNISSRKLCCYSHLGINVKDKSKFICVSVGYMCRCAIAGVRANLHNLIDITYINKKYGISMDALLYCLISISNHV